MDQNKFLKIMKKNLRCTNRKQKEICRDVQSDIQAALQLGESWEDIAKRMGNPAEIAKEFNENMSENEIREAQKSRNRRIVLTVCAIAAGTIAIVLFIIFNFWQQPKVLEFGSSGIYSQEVIDERTEEIISVVSAEQFDELRNKYMSPELAGQVSTEQLAEGKEMLGTQWGEYQKITSSYYFELEQDGQILVITEVNALYENRSVIYQLSFNENMELIGIFMR